jgi:hypothetical protein
VPLHRDLAASDVDTCSGFDPRAGIVHPFAPSSPASRVNGPTSSSEARSHSSNVFRPSRLCDQRCARPMNAKTTQTFENLSLRSVTDCVSSLRPMLPVLGAFHDAPCASAIRSRSLQWVFSTASGREFEILFSSGPPLTPLSPYQFAHHARATMSTSSAEIAFPILPVKRERLPRPETPSIEDDAERPAIPLRAPAFRVDESAILPPRLAVRRLFARRGLPLWASPRSPASPERRKLLWA